MIRRIINFGFIFIFMIFMAILFISGSLSGCSGGTDVGNPESHDFISDNELMAYLVDQYSNSVLPRTLRTKTIDIPSTNNTPLSPTTHDTPSANDGAFNAEGAGFSETNVQEAGVDESDKVKTDGTYIYIAGDTAVRIVDTAGETGMRKVADIEINGFVDSLYLFGDALVVLYTPEGGKGNSWQEGSSAIDVGMPYWIPVNAKVGILIIDISNPLYPETIRNIHMDGFLVSSRLTGGNLHVITQYFPDIPPIDIWYDGTASDLSQTVADNKQVLEAAGLDDFLPSYASYDDSGNIIDSGRLVDTQNFLRPADADGGTIVSIVSLDMADLSSDFSSVGFIADIHHVYASPNAMYMASTRYRSNTVAPNDATNGSSYQTRIYKFDLSQIPVAYKGSGQVQGHVLNQFSMGEYDNVIRIATTTGNVWDGSARNHVYCLGEQNGNLSVIGRLENLAPGERIYAARFIGTKGFLVTFVKIDPLFTLDLSDPVHPKAVGELKIPGYSTYIHPVGENYLLTIGKDAAADANVTWYQGLQISFFNISDFSNPDLISVEKIGDRGTESEALHNHKAFTFWAQENVFALPVNLYEHESAQAYPWDSGTYSSTDLYVYRITSENRIESLGRIPLNGESSDWLYTQGWIRGIFINDTIYAVNAETVVADPYLSIGAHFDFIDLTK